MGRDLTVFFPFVRYGILAGNDDRMQEVKFANGLLWGDVNTVVKNANGNVNVGIAWFAVEWRMTRFSSSPRRRSSRCQHRSRSRCRFHRSR